MILKGMQDRPEPVVRSWECNWHVFGPIPGATRNVAKCSQTDGLTEIPDVLNLDGQTIRPVICRSERGFLDLRKIFRFDKAYPVACLFTEITVPAQRNLPVSFGVACAARWWVNGKPAFDTAGGYGARSDDVCAHQFFLHLNKGRNVVQIKVRGGVVGWDIRLCTAEPAAVRHDSAPRIRLPRKPNRATRDYARAGLRIENRNSDTVPGPEHWKLESVARSSGVEARWIQVVDSRDGHQKLGSPFFHTRHLTPSPAAGAVAETRLKKWINKIHAEGMAVMSWFPMCFSTEAVLKHPDWASRPMPEHKNERKGNDSSHACINSPYGDALIRFAVEAIGKFDLDGFWFDGSYFAPFNGWIGCACRHCRRKFQQQTGRTFPRCIDWSDPDFQHWVNWRFKSFTEFWGRLAGRIRRAHPHARVAINHLHRVGTSWLQGCPLNPTGVEMVGASEELFSRTFMHSGFTTRLTRAYGYPQTETWIGLHALHGTLMGRPAAYLHHAMNCMTAGGTPSFGTDEDFKQTARCYAELADLINPRQPWVGGPSVPYAALHVSQQAETMFFSRCLLQKGVHTDPSPHGYWESVVGWNNLLTETQCLTDVVFDDHLTAAGLNRYPVLIMPLSVALSTAQIATLEDYVKGGGVLVAGPWLGSCDEWGERAVARRMRTLLGCNAALPPDPEAFQAKQSGVAVRKLGEGWVVRLAGDPGRQFHAYRSRRLALEVSGLIRKLAPARIAVGDDPDLHVGLFQRQGELVLHVQNGVGYSSSRSAFPNPVTVPPVLRHNVRIEIAGFPIRAVHIAVGEAGSRPRVQLKKHGAVITIPRLSWGSVYRLEI